jgi:hypothetical protein
VVHQKGYAVNTIARLLLVVCAIVVADAFATDQNASEAGQSPSQSSLGAPPQVGAQSTTEPSTIRPTATNPDSSSSGKPDTASQTSNTATSSATAGGHVVANKSGKKVLVDDTVNGAQLKQILARGYRPETQARGNEVYYCRGERELGSHFEKKVCKTATRILQDELQGKDATTRLEQTSGNVAVK